MMPTMLKVPHKEHVHVREARHFTVTQGVKVEVFLAEQDPEIVQEDTQEEVMEAAVAAPIQTAEPKESLPTQKETDLALAAMAYLSVLFLIPLAVRERSTFVDFHLRQGVFLFVAGVALSFSAWVSSYAWFAFAIGLAVFSATCAVQAARGRVWRFPLVGKLLKRITI